MNFTSTENVLKLHFPQSTCDIVARAEIRLFDYPRETTKTFQWIYGSRSFHGEVK